MASPSTAKSTGTVTVACGLPHGIIMEISARPPSKPGEAPVASPFPGKRVMLIGTHHVARTMEHFEARPGTPFGLTHNVPADFWDAWAEAHKDCEFMVNGLVYANADAAKAEAGAKERRGAKSVEKLDGSKLPKAPKTGEVAVEDHEDTEE